YGRLLGGMIAEARQAGVRRVEISTQVHNVDVQRVWQKLGFRIFDTELTIHLYKSKQAEGL
ncbi:MAG: hypothetical protein KDD43_12185, partial [Bdellovibrionales bacterium]|nr:hypothetical protein [Bdellovibrionales bacterium]